MISNDLFAKFSDAVSEGNEIAYLYQGLVHMRNKNDQSAEHAFNVAREKGVTDHWLDYALGEMAFYNKRYEDTIDFMQKTLAKNPLFYSAYPKLIDALSRTGQFVRRDKVVRFIKESLPAFPANLKMEMEELFAQVDKNTTAEDVPEKEVVTRKNESQIDNIIDEIEQAEYTIEEKDVPDAHQDFGDIMSGIFEEKDVKTDQTTIENESDVLNKDTTDEPAAINESVTSGEDKNDVSSAVSPEKKPTKRIVSKTLGEIYASQGQIDEAVKVFELLLEQNPGNEEIIRKLSELKKL